MWPSTINYLKSLFITKRIKIQGTDGYEIIEDQTLTKLLNSESITIDSSEVSQLAQVPYLCLIRKLNEVLESEFLSSEDLLSDLKSKVVELARLDQKGRRLSSYYSFTKIGSPSTESDSIEVATINSSANGLCREIPDPEEP